MPKKKARVFGLLVQELKPGLSGKSGYEQVNRKTIKIRVFALGFYSFWVIPPVGGLARLQGLAERKKGCPLFCFGLLWDCCFNPWESPTKSEELLRARPKAKGISAVPFKINYKLSGRKRKAPL